MHYKESRRHAFYIGDLVKLAYVNSHVSRQYGYGVVVSVENGQPFKPFIGVLWQNGLLAYEAEIDIELVSEVDS